MFGMSMVLLNFGLDELGNPRLRAAGSVKVGRRTWRPSDPTPVLRDHPQETA
jgi:hypothetical protein